MAAGITIKHKRKAGAFSNGELAAGEFGVDTTNGVVYFSANGTTVVALPATAYSPGGTDVAVADGGTGASDATTARTNLGIGSIAVENQGTAIVQFANNGLLLKGFSTYYLGLQWIEAGTASRSLFLNLGDTSRTLTMSGDATISGTNTGNETTTTEGALINGATSKTTPVDADYVGLMDSAASNILKKLSWANIKATAKTYFDTLYQGLNSNLTTIAGLTATTNNFIVSVGSAWASRTPSQVRTTLGLVIGTNVQAYDADLDTWATKTAPSGTVLGTTDTQTLTNKTLLATTNVIEEITTVASSSTPAPTGGSLRNFFTVTALAAGATISAPSGTPANGNQLIMRIKDNGTARTLAYNAIFRAVGVTLPTTTVISKTLYIGCKYNSADTKWDVIAVAQEA